MALDIERIFEAIKNLPIKEALTYIVQKKITNFLEISYSKIKQLIQDKYNESKYAFVPDKKEALKLKELVNNPNYVTLYSLIPSYQYLDVILTGLLIRDYIKSGDKLNHTRIQDIKKEILQRPNGDKLLKIVRLPTTPFFSTVLNHLYRLQQKNYSKIQLKEKFDEIVNDWELSSLPVKADTTETIIRNFFIQQAELQKRNFFLLGMKSAGERLEIVTTQLEKENFFKNHNYKFIITKSDEGIEPRVEVVVYRPDSEFFLSD